MEIFGGFMVMMSIISLFLAVVWLIMPFVVFAIKGKQDRTLEVLETIEKRLAALEAGLQPAAPGRATGVVTGNSASAGSSDESSHEHLPENAVIPPESAAVKNGSEPSPAA